MSVIDLGIDGLDHLEQIGSGGSSRVYRARQSDLDRVVAVKVINSGQDPDVARRFDRERKAMGRLSNHEGIVPVYSTGVTPSGESYLVMPYYPTGSIQDQIDRGPLDWRSTVAYIDVVAETMAAAHEEGIVHLDIKPANILLTATGSPRIADFGIAKLASGSGVAARTTGTAFTPAYSAPETFLDGQATPAADVYGLGATLWACLVGHPPFLGPGEDTNLMAVIGRVVNNPLGDVRHLAPEPICRVINQAMAKDPHDRFTSARQFSMALRDAMAEVGIGQRRQTNGVGAAASAGQPEAPPRTDQTAVHQFMPPVPYGAGSQNFVGADQDPAFPDETQIFGDRPAAPTVASARTINRGPALVAGPAPPSTDMARSLLQQTADTSHYHGGPPPIVERTPFVDFDRFRFGPLVAGLVALIAVGLLAGWALTRGGADPDSGVAAINEQSPPAGPETDGESQVGNSIDLSLSGSTTSTSLSSTTSASPQQTTVTTTATTATTVASTSSSATATTAATTTTTEATTSTTASTTSSTTTSTTVVVGDLMPPENVAATAVNADVTVTWTPPSSGPTPSSYVIYRNGAILANVASSPYVDLGLAPGTYRYRVAAVGPNATESDLSLPASVDVAAPVPLVMTASLSGSTRTSLTIRVDSNPCMANIRVSYLIDGSGDTPEVLAIAHNPCVTQDTILIPGLRPNATYRVNVTATGTDGGTGAALPMLLTTG